FAIEIGFEPMTNGLMQQNSRPPRSEHYFHLACRSLASVKLNNGLPRCVLGKIFRSLFAVKEVESHAAAATGLAAGGIIAVLGDADHTEASHGLQVAGKSAVRTNYQDLPQFVSISAAHLHDAWIVGACRAIGSHHQFKLRCDVSVRRRRRYLIQLMDGCVFEALNRLLAGTTRDERRCARSAQDFFWSQIVCMRVASTLSGKNPHSTAG